MVVIFGQGDAIAFGFGIGGSDGIESDECLDSFGNRLILDVGSHLEIFQFVVNEIDADVAILVVEPRKRIGHRCVYEAMGDMLGLQGKGDCQAKR